MDPIVRAARRIRPGTETELQLDSGKVRGDFVRTDDRTVTLREAGGGEQTVELADVRDVVMLVSAEPPE